MSPGATLLRLGLPDALSGIGGSARLHKPANDRPGYPCNRFPASNPAVVFCCFTPCRKLRGLHAAWQRPSPSFSRPHIDNPAHRLPNSVTNSVSDNRDSCMDGTACRAAEALVGEGEEEIVEGGEA